MGVGSKWRVVGAIALLAAFLSSIIAPVARAQSATVPPVTAEAVYMFDSTAGVVLYEQNSSEHLSPASTTKIATALVVMKYGGDLDAIVEVAPDEVIDASEGQSIMALLAGDQVTVRGLLYGLLLPSGNDAARVLARYVGGRILVQEGADGDPVARFVQAMNDEVMAFGLTDTQFTNPAGLYDPNHFSSAHDMAMLGAQLMADPVLAGIVGTTDITIDTAGPNPRGLYIVNSNRLLGTDGITGMKTGTLPEAGACLVAAKTGPAGDQVIGVVLGSDIEFDADQVQIYDTDQRYNDMQALFDQMVIDYQWLTADDVATIPGLSEELQAWGVRVAADQPIIVPAGDGEALGYFLQLGPPVDANQPAGELLIYRGEDVIAQVPVIQG